MKVSGWLQGMAVLIAGSLYLGFLARSPSPGTQGGVGQRLVAVDPESGELLGLRESTQNEEQLEDARGTGTTTGQAARKQRGKQGLECARGRNGGATDTGVNGSQIHLASTVVQGGPARSLLQDSVLGMKAVIDKVNRPGGVCGRLLSLTVNDDGFDAVRGQQYIENYINQGFFALPVVPSAEGLSSAIAAKSIARAGIPVVGSDGMRIEQYNEAWVWPVATATVSTMRILASYGYHNKGARTFAIVWDSKYKFGIEGADAFKHQVASFPGCAPSKEGELSPCIRADIALDPLQSSYSTEVNQFNGLCGCDMVALLLLPDAGEKWFARGPDMGEKYTAGAQTLFSDDFAEKCTRAAGDLCHGLAVWTGYVPAIGPLRGLPGIEAFENDVRAVSPRIDVRNQFLQGAYLGMSVFVEALRKVGPELTRARLREVLDSMTYQSDLASTLSWQPGKHAANVRARAFAIVTSTGDFRDWRDEHTDWVADPVGGP